MPNSIHSEDPNTVFIRTSSLLSNTSGESDEKSTSILHLRYPGWWRLKKRILATSILATLITLVTGTCYCLAIPLQSGVLFGCDPAGNVWVADAEPSRKLSVWDLEYILYPSVPLFRSSFIGAKAMDICWDTFVGRGYSFLAGSALYFTFKVVLLDVMKDSPIPQGSVLAIQYSTVSVQSIYTHCKGLCRRSSASKRHWSLAVYMILLQLIISIAYVLIAPTWLSAMTSYQTTMDPILKFENNNISFTNLQPCSWGVVDGSRIGVPEIDDNTCVPSSGILHDAVRQYTESQPYLQCHPPRNFVKEPNIKHAPTTFDQNCDLNSSFIWNGKPHPIDSPVLNIRKGTFKYFDQGSNVTHVLNATFLQSDHSICQPSQPTVYEWGFSFPMLFSFMVTTVLLGLSVLLTWFVYCDRSEPQEIDLLFGPIRTALVVSTSVREALGGAVDELSGEDLEHLLSASSDGVKLGRANDELANQSDSWRERRVRNDATFPVGSELYRMYIEQGFNGLSET